MLVQDTIQNLAGLYQDTPLASDERDLLLRYVLQSIDNEARDFVDLCTRCPVFLSIWQLYWHGIFDTVHRNSSASLPSESKPVARPIPPLPRSLRDLQAKRLSVLLQPVLLFVLAHTIPIPVDKQLWECIYSSERDGKSWTIMSTRLPQAEQSVVIIKTAQGHVFGSFIPMPLLPSPQFASNRNALLFGHKPELRVYTAQNINQNHVYYNYSSKSFPNGIGCGGQLEFHAWFLAQDFSQGHCRGDPSSTFGNPLLSDETWTLDQIEVWALEPRDTETLAYKRSIVDNPETAALLEMAGKELYSKNLPRAPDPE
ncbi:hypothetical protein HDV03_002469 [Kappamyces sp. JEL0829]|nr:hypothetical protein HDV03_002469 [Kappamyces sp. JEL0829]